MDELLIGYKLNALSNDEQAHVETQLAQDPKHRRKLDQLDRLLQPLAALPEPQPPRDLWLNTLNQVAIYALENQLLPDESSESVPAYDGELSDSSIHSVLANPSAVTFEELQPVSARRSYLTRRWIEVGLTASIIFLGVGMVVTGMMKIRHTNQVAQCQQHMQTLYKGMTGYADTNNDHYPKIGTPTTPTAGSFIQELVNANQLPPDVKGICPIQQDKAGTLTPVAYAYTLGYRTPKGELLGIRRGHPDVPAQRMPLLADLPTSSASPTDQGPMSPHGRGQNILYSDGHIQYSRIATVGPNNDDIYRNQNGLVHAGINALDASLGRADDIP